MRVWGHQRWSPFLLIHSSAGSFSRETTGKATERIEERRDGQPFQGKPIEIDNFKMNCLKFKIQLGHNRQLDHSKWNKFDQPFGNRLLTMEPFETERFQPAAATS